MQKTIAIIGGGHNALTAAAYLARAGAAVTVLERLDHVGGAAHWCRGESLGGQSASMDTSERHGAGHGPSLSGISRGGGRRNAGR